MTLQPGQQFKASPSLQGDFFENALILITSIRPEGATGLVLNQNFDRPLNHLTEFKNQPALPIKVGGPVDQEHLFILHQRPDLIQESEKVTETIYTGGSLKQALTAIEEGKMSRDELKIFLGYCGWDAGELEAEIEEGSWLPSIPQIIF